MIIPPTTIRISASFSLHFHVDDARGYEQEYLAGNTNLMVKQDLCTFGACVILSLIHLGYDSITVDEEYLPQELVEDWAEHGRLY